MGQTVGMSAFRYRDRGIDKNYSLALHIAADEFVLPSSILAQLCVDDAEIPAPRPPELRFGSFGRIDIATYDGVSRRIAEGTV